MVEFLNPLFDWLSQHPAWAGAMVFAIAMGESLLIVGLVVPGTVMMFGVGALVGAGAMGLGETMIWAFLGAIAGDGVSFWIGRRYSDRIRQWWPFSRHPEWMAHGEAFFRRHGGKSILFGRFVGPVRPVIPAVAGMLGMRPAVFMTVNIFSAAGWAPAYLLPGVVFGTSLGLATEVATRLAVLLLGLAGLVFLLLWIIRRLFLFIEPRATSLISRTLAWSYNHPRLGGLAAAVIDPRHPELKGLLVLAGILVASTWLFIAVLANIRPLGGINQYVFNLIREFRTPWADQIMVLFHEMGDPGVLSALILGVLVWFTARNNWKAASHWIAATGFGITATLAFKALLEVPRPEEIQVTFANSFPSWHAVMGTTTFGFLAVLIAGELTPPRRWLPYATAGVAALLLAVSGLYLGSQWLSDVVGGAALGVIWVTLVGIAYRRHHSRHISPQGVGLVAVSVFLVAVGWHVYNQHQQDLQRYAVRYNVKEIDFDAWWEGEWRSLPAYRTDLTGHLKQPLDIQWAGSLADIRAFLHARGWQTPVTLSFANALRWMSPEPKIAQLPVLPNVFMGRHESLLMVLRGKRAEAQLVLRLWPADMILKPGDKAVWVGTVARQYLVQPLGLLALQRTETDFIGPLREFLPFVSTLSTRRVSREGDSLDADKMEQWQGQVVLIAGPGLVKF